VSVDTLLTTPSELSGLDAKVVQKMHYVKDSNDFRYYDDNGVWYYDFITVAEGTDAEFIKQMKENMEKEDFNLENDDEMEDAEEDTSDDEDLDYDPENDHHQTHDQHHSKEVLGEVLNGIKDLKKYMTQRFDAQELKFKEINKRFDAQDVQFKEVQIQE